MPSDDPRLNQKIDNIEAAIKEISGAVQALAAAETRNAETSIDLKAIRSKMQQVSETIAALPNREEVKDMYARIGKAENRITALETEYSIHRDENDKATATIRKMIYGLGALILALFAGNYKF